MARGIDHLVLAVHDLASARALYESLGFTVTPDAQHPWGTTNCLVQLDGSFLEIICVDRPELLTEPLGNAFSFGTIIRDFLETSEGFAMLVLESADAANDLKDYSNNGIHAFDPFGFSRIAKLPDGEEVTVSFSIAATKDPLAPNAAFFSCQQHAPQYFWKKEYQTHANTALAIREVSQVSEGPAMHEGFFKGYSGVETAKISDQELVIETPRGRISVQTPTLSEKVWGQPNRTMEKPCLNGFRIAVADMSAAKSILASNNVAHEDRNDHLLISASNAMGVAIILEQA